jgi:3'(2'), 5'-bisphosphate nucleotidase
MNLSELSDPLIAAARRAGDAILAVRAKGLEVREKADHSPVTEADEVAEGIILAVLHDIAPAIPVVAEESVAHDGAPDVGTGRFWLVDPLDGTKEFIAGRDEFTVNIALIGGGNPIMGVVYLPALDELYLGIAGNGAWRQWPNDAALDAIAVRRVPKEGLTVLASRSHRTPEVDAYLAPLSVVELRSAGSSLKFCVLACGQADLYPRFGRTMEWDTAAGDAVLRAAGGSVTTLDGAALCYAKPGFANPDFIARGDVSE